MGQVDATRRGHGRARELPADASELGEQRVALPCQVGDLRTDPLLLGAGLVADLRGLLLGSLQDALHAVGEVADDIGRPPALLRRMSGTRPRRGPWRPAGVPGAGLGHDGDRMAACHVEVGAHPGHHSLEAGHVLIDLFAVVAPEYDVEIRGAERTRVTRHPSSLPSAIGPPPRRG
jgi:hypothetical protein